MVTHFLKSAIIALPLITACGGKTNKKPQEQAPQKPVQEEPKPVEEIDPEQSALRHEILSKALFDEFVSYEMYEEHLENNTVPIYHGKNRDIVKASELFNLGIFFAEDAFRELEWLERWDRDRVAYLIRGFALMYEYIDDDERHRLDMNDMVPTFADGLRTDIPEEDLLKHWIIDYKDAFKDGVHPGERQ